jgi:hypothetical protein
MSSKPAKASKDISKTMKVTKRDTKVLNPLSGRLILATGALAKKLRKQGVIPPLGPTPDGPFGAQKPEALSQAPKPTPQPDVPSEKAPATVVVKSVKRKKGAVKKTAKAAPKAAPKAAAKTAKPKNINANRA